MGGYIMQVQSFSVNDGEGIRSTVFFAGCPLRCAWCANPEGQTQNNPMTRWAETNEIVEEIQKHMLFYRFSGGGVTFSGGEATAQPEFLSELTETLYESGYDLALETCGHFDFGTLAPTLKKMNLIFMDLKHADSEKHKRFTGIGNELILHNMLETAALGVPMVIRIPVILGFNEDDASMKAAFGFLQQKLPGASVELLPYHRFGEEKYRQLGMKAPGERFEIPTSEQIKNWERLAASFGLKVVSYK